MNEQASQGLSLKRRVMFALAAIVTLFTGLQGLLAFLSLRELEDDLADQLVLAETRRLAALLAGNGGGARADLHPPPPNFSVWLVGPDGDANPEPLPGYLRALADGPHRPAGAGGDLHVVVLPTPAGRLFVQYDAKLNEAKVYEFGYYQLGLGALCVLLAMVVARRLAAVVVAPIERITGLLAAWAPDAPGGDGGAANEENRLLDAFRRVQARFERSMADEREFLANVRHEIRTPLTALRTDLEMLALARSGAGEQQRLQSLMRSVDGISASLEATRALSHRQPVQAQEVPLARCVDDAWASLGASPELRGLRFANEVPAEVMVRADRHALLTILRNLILNAAEHAAPARCTVRLAINGIAVEDDGPGIAPADQPFVFERYYRGRLADASPADGDRAGDRGLGLAIARQVADLNGWKLGVEGVEPRGTRFVLQLPGL